MPRKKFEDTPYDPIRADLAREVGAAGRGGNTPSVQPLSPPNPQVVELRVERTQPSVGSTALKMQEPLSPQVAPRPKVPEPTITKRFVVTRSEDQDITGFLLKLQERAGTKIPLSVLARAAISIVMQAEDQIFDEVSEKLPLELPSTHDAIAQAEYEEQWIRVLSRAFRKMPRR